MYVYYIIIIQFQRHFWRDCQVLYKVVNQTQIFDCGILRYKCKHHIIRRENGNNLTTVLKYRIKKIFPLKNIVNLPKRI